MEKYIRIQREVLFDEYLRVLLKNGFENHDARICADIFTSNSIDGVNSHGINRFPRFIRNVTEGYVRPAAVPSLIHSSGSLEQWEGNLGAGPLNAEFATRRTTEIASENGIGMVTLAHTNHWMRGGKYGWQAARKGFVLICWTNTCQNMPAWGATDPKIGNNPLVLAVPYKDEAIVLDFAMSLYSYGKLESYKNEGKRLDYPGGYNSEGELTDSPEEILESWRVLPAGYWKGSGLSVLLDILAASLSGGLSTSEIGNCETEYSVSQVFIAIDLKRLHNFPSIDRSIQKIIDDLHSSQSATEGSNVLYPGERILKVRADNLKNGIMVPEKSWENVLKL